MTALWMAEDGARRIHNLIKRAAPDLTVRASLTPKWTRDAPPEVIVQSDGTPVATRAGTRELVRVRVQARDLPRARQLMVALDAYLLSPGLMLGAAITAGTGIIAGPDSKVGGAYASATYNISLPRKVKS